MKTAKNIAHSFSHLFFPQTCMGCGNDLAYNKHFLCIHCSQHLPFTGFELFPHNPVEKAFWGRSNIRNAMSLLYFSKDSIVQNLMHKFKYKGRKEIGQYFGNKMGERMLQSNRFDDIDAIVPLPLFPSKERIRGYNQASILCNGIAEKMKIPVIGNAVIRSKATETQTYKNRVERWINIEGKFEVVNPAAIKDRHVLLVDDVITTGATLEACANKLLELGNTELSIATMAYASI